MAKPAVARTPAPSKPSQEVATVKTGGALMNPNTIPEFMRGLKGQGTENITSADIETPRIKLLQLVSPECEEFDHAKAGGFWHSIAEEYLGTEVRIVPLYVDMRAILWRPRHEGGGILARSDDGVHWVPPNAEFVVRPSKDSKKTVTWRTKPTVAASGLLDWGSSDPEDSASQPAATKMFNIAVIMPDFPHLGPAVLTCQRSSVKPARKFLGKLKMMSVPSYGTIFKMGCSKEGEGSDTYYNYNFAGAGFVETVEDFNIYKDLYENFKAMGLQIKDLEGAQDEVIEHTDAETGTKPTY